MREEKPDKFWKGESRKVKKGRSKVAKPKINLERENIRNGLAQLILTVVELLRELMEKQAIRRIEAGKLTDDQTENLGNTFMALKEELEKLKGHFKIEDEDLSLGSFMVKESDEVGQVSAVEILDRLLGKGVVVKGDVVISVAEVDLISLNLGLLLASIDKARELYSKDIRTEQLEEEVKRLRASLSQKKKVIS